MEVWAIKIHEQLSLPSRCVQALTPIAIPPEAVQDKPVYTEKIDCFLCDVIVVQTITYESSPNPEIDEREFK
jgi:hypothetical protein